MHTHYHVCIYGYTYIHIHVYVCIPKYNLLSMYNVTGMDVFRNDQWIHLEDNSCTKAQRTLQKRGQEDRPKDQELSCEILSPRNVRSYAHKDSSMRYLIHTWLCQFQGLSLFGDHLSGLFCLLQQVPLLSMNTYWGWIHGLRFPHTGQFQPEIPSHGWVMCPANILFILHEFKYIGPGEYLWVFRLSVRIEHYLKSSTLITIIMDALWLWTVQRRTIRDLFHMREANLRSGQNCAPSSVPLL